MRILVLAAVAVIGLSGCVVKQDPPVSDEVLAASVYRHDGPPRLTLFTMINNRSGNGAHSALMINGSQRVIFDPAGSFRKGGIVSRDDVVYDVTPGLADVFTRFHARKTHHVVVQELDVSAEAAEQALQLAMARGEVPDAYCARSISTILSQLPGLEGMKTTWFPKPLSAQFDQLDGATRTELYEYDDGDRFKALEAFDPERVKDNMKANGV
ncbi:hypothetical protein [Thalassobius sp. Cn5-15]|jgi:hypothetical protein|uniref:hypothetical protein n=1 Tax=Thalassobius sp. Cn5-15 TaxID=2917763 RepID=UPI001EF2F7B6|nr:hypothetical protein [Thalassobius sp. Cn5-15]MCG7493411.1 hypothetical protein [Thalassobius sp. Cn5-15]